MQDSLSRIPANSFLSGVKSNGRADESKYQLTSGKVASDHQPDWGQHLHLFNKAYRSSMQ